MAGSATRSLMEWYGRAGPTSSLRARSAALPACSRLGLQTPSTSASRTPVNAWRWKRALKPLPITPIPSRLFAIPSGLILIAHAELLERRLGTAFPFWYERVAPILQILDPHLAGPES